MKHTRRLKRTAFGTMLLTSTVLLFMMVGTSLALTDPVYVHDQIILRDSGGSAISYDPGNLTPAFSAMKTCGVSGCHDGSTLDGDGVPLLSYTEIESHSYHAQMGANNLAGWNKNDTAKRWVQSGGHFGKW